MTLEYALAREHLALMIVEESNQACVRMPNACCLVFAAVPPAMLLAIYV